MAGWRFAATSRAAWTCSVADERNPAEEAALAAVARHALHDEELVAAHAANGLESEGEVAQARALVERCAVCRDLHRDVAAIGVALATEASFTAGAPRDFRLTVEDAQRLGGRVSPQGVLASFRRRIIGYARPVGASLATLGFVGLLVGSAVIGSGGSLGSLAGMPAPAATAAPGEVQGGTRSEVPKSTTLDVALGPTSTGGTDYGTNTPPERDEGTAGWSPIAWLVWASVAMLVVGVVLLAIAFRQGRRGARRSQDP